MRLLLVAVLFLPLAARAGVSSMCDSVQAVANFTGQFTTVPWMTIQYSGPAPVPGVVMATLEGDSILLDFCMVVKQFEKMRGYNKVKKVFDYANELTDRKYNEHLEFATSTYDIYSSAMDMSKTGDGIDQAEGLTLARRLDRYLDDSEEYINGQTGRTDETFATRAEREAKMGRLVNSAQNIARYRELLSCPRGKEVDENLRDVFGRDMEEKRLQLSVWEADVDFLMDSLEDMGIKFSNGVEDFREYVQGLWNLYNAGVKYQAKVRTYRKDSAVYNKKKDQADKKKVPMAYQKFSVAKNPKLFESFRSKYVGQWASYMVKKVMADGSFGLLDRPVERAQEDFRYLQFECRESRLRRHLLQQEPFLSEGDKSRRFADALKREKEKCQSASSDQNSAKNLMNYYLVQLETALEQYKQAQADIWTIESYHLGTTRNVSVSTQDSEMGPIRRESVSCGQKISPAEISLLQAQLEAENTQLRGDLVEGMLKKSARMQAQAEREKKRQEEERRRRELEIERKRRQESDYSQYVKFPELKESF